MAAIGSLVERLRVPCATADSKEAAREIEKLHNAIRLLLEMPSACTKDDEVIENIRRRKIARSLIEE